MSCVRYLHELFTNNWVHLCIPPLKAAPPPPRSSVSWLHLDRRPDPRVPSRPLTLTPQLSRSPSALPFYPFGDVHLSRSTTPVPDTLTSSSADPLTIAEGCPLAGRPPPEIGRDAPDRIEGRTEPVGGPTREARERTRDREIRRL